MLKKLHRKLRSSEVSILFAQDTQSVGDRFFRINWVDTDTGYPQVVVVTPRKLSLSAVERNSIRRRVYTLVQQVFSQWTVGRRIAILIKSPALKLSSSELREQLVSLLKRAGMINKSEI